MSAEQDVVVETPAAEVADNDVAVEEVQNDEPENQEAEASQTDGEPEEEQKPKTVEERLADVESKYEEKTRAAEAMQAKINRQTAAYNELQRKLQSEREELQAKLNSNQEEAEEPSVDDFDTHADYVDAVASFRAEKMVKQKEGELLQKQQMETMQKMAHERSQIALQQEVEYVKENPRYKASKGEFESFLATSNIPKEVETAFVETAFMGNVPELINYFGANSGERIGELEAISKMPPIKAAIEVYKIQQKLKSEPKPKETKTLSKPVNSPKGMGKATKDLSKGDVLKNLGLK